VNLIQEPPLREAPIRAGRAFREPKEGGSRAVETASLTLVSAPVLGD
jgi:hypothetical protein